MFGFKKQTTNNIEKVETPEQRETRERQEKVGREVKIISMPEKFRSERAVASQSKTVGLIIIGVAFLFLVVMVILFYVFVFKKGNSSTAPVASREVATPVSVAPIVKEPVQNIVVSTSTELALATSSLPIATTTEEVASSTLTSQIIDYDQDGLNAPEESLLGTSDSSIDSDGDGYSDITELSNLFNPAGVGKIDGNKNITRYDNLTYGYSILYPSAWAKSRVGGDDSIIFSSSDNNYIQVVAQANTKIESIGQWYQRQFGSGSLTGAENVVFPGWQGLRNKDSGDYYFTDKARRFIFSLSYTPGSDKADVYKNIFALMAKSLTVK